MSELTFIPRAVELSKQAVAEDNAENYERAKQLYTSALECVIFSCTDMSSSSCIHYAFVACTRTLIVASTFLCIFAPLCHLMFRLPLRSYFMMGLKYEKNENTKLIIRQKLKEYMDRAEQITALLQSKANPQPAPAPDTKKKKGKADKGDGGKDDKKADGDGGGSDDDDDDDADPETKKLQASLSHAILVERPNVSWDDVAGLETAKALTKEAVLLPLRYPQLFTGKRRPWKGACVRA